MIKLSEKLLAVIQVGQWEMMLLDEGSEKTLLLSAEPQVIPRDSQKPLSGAKRNLGDTCTAFFSLSYQGTL